MYHTSILIEESLQSDSGVAHESPEICTEEGGY